MSDPDADAAYAAALRLTTGVTVLTVRHEDRMHGSTVSSTSLLSRSPMIVGAGLRPGSVLADLAWRSGRFAVNVLCGRQALIADWFADPDRPPGTAQFERIGWLPDPDTGLPLLEGTAARLICRVCGRVPVAGHDLLLGEVVAGQPGSGSPLISHRGALYSAELRDVARRDRAPVPAGAVSLD